MHEPSAEDLREISLVAGCSVSTPSISARNDCTVR